MRVKESKRKFEVWQSYFKIGKLSRKLDTFQKVDWIMERFVHLEIWKDTINISVRILNVILTKVKQKVKKKYSKDFNHIAGMRSGLFTSLG